MKSKFGVCRLSMYRENNWVRHKNYDLIRQLRIITKPAFSPAILSRDVVTQLYRAKRSPSATVHAASSTNRTNKHGLCIISRLLRPFVTNSVSQLWSYCHIFLFFLALSLRLRIWFAIERTSVLQLFARMSSPDSLEAMFVWLFMQQSSTVQHAHCAVAHCNFFAQKLRDKIAAVTSKAFSLHWRWSAIRRRSHCRILELLKLRS